MKYYVVWNCHTEEVQFLTTLSCWTELTLGM